MAANPIGFNRRIGVRGVKVQPVDVSATWAWSGDDRCCGERMLRQRQGPGIARGAQACLCYQRPTSSLPLDR
jgi:hypothetical protein